MNSPQRAHWLPIGSSPGFAFPVAILVQCRMLARNAFSVFFVIRSVFVWNLINPSTLLGMARFWCQSVCWCNTFHCKDSTACSEACPFSFSAFSLAQTFDSTLQHNSARWCPCRRKKYISLCSHRTVCACSCMKPTSDLFRLKRSRLSHRMDRA